MDGFIIPIVSAVAAVVANAIYISMVKKDLDKRLESYKIAYSGIFKEKLDLYKTILESMENLRIKVVNYGHAGDNSNFSQQEIMDEFNKFIRLNEHGAIFFNDIIKQNISEIRNDFQQVFDLSIQNHFSKQLDIKNSKIEQYMEKLSELTRGEKYSNLKENLIQSIRKDFNIQ